MTFGRPLELRARWVLAGIFSTYLLTRYPDVGGRINMGDSAKFQFLGRMLGIGHSPGNPLYLLASALWARAPLPISDAAKATLLSSLFGVITLGLVARAVSLFRLPPILSRPFLVPAPSFAILLLGTGSLFWTFATEAEVYTLGTVFVAGVLLGVTRWAVLREERGLVLAGGCLILGLANHLTILALAPGLVFVLVRDREARAALKRPLPWLAFAGALVLAALAYGWIAWRVSRPLAYSEFPKTVSAKTFLGFITARDVRAGTFARTTYAAAIFERLPELFGGLARQWSWPLAIFVPFGVIRIAQRAGIYAGFLLLGIVGHLVLAFLFRIPDPEGLFLSVAVLVTVPLVFVPQALGALVGERLTTPAALAMLGLHGLVSAAHLAQWWTHPFSAYVQQTPEGQVVVAYPTLADVVPDEAMIAVPCGHYGCVEVTNYYRFVDEGLRRKGVTFVRLPWSEWDDGVSPVPVVDPRAPRRRPICVLLKKDVTQLRELGLAPTPIPRSAVRVLGRTFVSPPLQCLR